MIDPLILSQCIDELGLSYKNGVNSYIFDCPNCGKADILYMYRASGTWRCMKEGRGSKKPEYALSDISGIPVSQIKKILYKEKWKSPLEENNDFQLDFSNNDEIEIPIIPVINWKFDEYEIDHPFSTAGAEYLASRGIPLNIAIKYDIHYCPTRLRVLFPVKLDGKLVGHQDRLIVDHKYWDEEEEKYKEVAKITSSDDLPSSRIPMNADSLNHSDTAIICEGPIDMIKFDMCNVGNTATMGKGLAQIRYYRSKNIKRVYIALDDNAASESKQLADEFQDLEVFYIKPLPGKDFGAMTFEECLEAFNKAEPVENSTLFLYLE